MNIKILNYLLIFCMSALYACVDDTSMYAFQEKEKVEIDNSYVDEAGVGSGRLKPGLVTDTIEVPNAQIEQKRVFKYYFPLSLQPDKPVTLIFNFHGSINSDPLNYVDKTNLLNTVADTVNAIIVYPRGIAQNGDTYNWVEKEENLLLGRPAL